MTPVYEEAITTGANWMGVASDDVRHFDEFVVFRLLRCGTRILTDEAIEKMTSIQQQVRSFIASLSVCSI